MAKSWQEVQSVLDDPYVSADTKELLLAAYVRENSGPFGLSNVDEEVQDYTDGTKASYKLDGSDVYGGQLLGTDNVYDAAQEESNEKGYSAGLAADGVEDGRTEIENMTPPAEGSTAGVQTSDEIFEAARPSLRIWEDFLPVNDKVPSDSLGRYGKINLDTDIKQRFDEQLGISFNNFLDDATRLREAHGTLTELNSFTETELNNLYKEWTGPAANASYQNYSQKIVPNVTDLLEYLSASPDMIGTLVENLYTACKDKANDVIALYQGVNGTMGSATLEMADKVVKLANGDFSSQDEVLDVAAWVDSVTGSNLEQTMREDDCGMNDENKEYVIRECKKWIRDSFNADLHENLYVNFKQACDDAFEAVNTHYETLNAYLSEYENKFAAAQQPGPSQPNPYQPPPQNNPNQPPPNVGGDSGGGGNGGGGSGGGGNGGGATMPPPPTPPEMPTPPPTDPSGTDPNGPGGPGDPNQPGGPGDPGNPGIPTSPGGGDQQETVTIQDGEREISVTSPDGQGQVKVTVDDGSGKPKTYTLDFGGADPATLPGTPGGGQPGGPQGVVAGEPGPDGQPPTVPGQDAPIEPGPDGKCVITDGDMTITAERPEGQPDTVVVTVDDGTGEPTTYNLDYSEAGTQGVEPAGPQPITGEARPAVAYGEMPPELADANQQVDQAQFTQEGVSTQPTPGELPQSLQGDLSTQPAFGEMPAQLQAEPPVSTQPAYGAMPEQTGPGISTQPAYGEMPQTLQGDLSTQPAYGEPPQSPQSDQHAFATTASAANDPGASSFNAGSGPHAASGEAGSFFGGQDQSSSPYMHGNSGEAGLSTAPDGPVAADGPGSPQGQDQAHPGMAGGGMPMMGGAGGGGGGGGDAERGGTQWRTTGDLFDEPVDPQQLRNAFGGDDR